MAKSPFQPHSQPHSQPQSQATTNIIIQAAQANSFGSAGFWISLVSFFCCGFLSPLGLLFSLVGLLKAPRGMALAGTILGGLGSWWLFAFGFVMVMGMLGMSQAAKDARERARQQSTAPADPSPAVPAPGIPLDETPALEETPTDETSVDPSTMPEESTTEEIPNEPASESPGESEPSPGESSSAETTDEVVARLQREENERKAREASKPQPIDEDAAKWRTWTSGKFSIRAKFITKIGQQVTLEKEDGTRIKIAIDKLSLADADWISGQKWKQP